MSQKCSIYDSWLDIKKVYKIGKWVPTCIMRQKRANVTPLRQFIMQQKTYIWQWVNIWTMSQKCSRYDSWLHIKKFYKIGKWVPTCIMRQKRANVTPLRQFIMQQKNLQHLTMSEYLDHESKMFKVRQLITYQKGL